MLSYEETIAAIKAECAKINLSYASGGDGRITSAVKEKEYLDLLEIGLITRDPTIRIERPKERHWYDIRINHIPINLKLTTGGTDNAFNKVAILFTLSGTEVTKRNMNYNQFYKTIQETPKKAIRDRATEYHYLAVHKDNGSILLKSILDIHTYKTNPCNDLQINWNNEFAHMDYVVPDSDYQKKVIELLSAIQTSVRQAIAGMKEFAESNLTTLFS